MLKARWKVFIAALALSALAGPALADAIDGNWCHTDGRRFSIRGPEIVTPGGKRMEGSYSRHWFNSAHAGAGRRPGGRDDAARREHRASARRCRRAGNLGALRALGQCA